MAATATAERATRWSRRVLAAGTRMSYRQLDHACTRVPALARLTNIGSGGGGALLTDAEAAEHQRMLATVDRLLAVGLDDADLLDAACRATLLHEPGTEVTLVRSHRHGRWTHVVSIGGGLLDVAVRIVVG